jgi:hypothetical protein
MPGQYDRKAARAVSKISPKLRAQFLQNLNEINVTRNNL